MKTLKIKSILCLLMVSALFLNVLSSCSEDDDTSGTLRIDSVSLTGHNEVDGEYIPKDSLTTTGYAGNMYIIRGSGFATTQKVLFNDFQADFNPTLVTDKVIIVTIPVGTPYVDGSNKLIVITTAGTAEYDFVIGQPAPTITGFNPLAGSPGDIVTITGTIFDNLISVRFDDVEAVVVSSTSTQIQVEVPAGIIQAKIFVETLGGTAESASSFGFKFLVYDDVLAPGWWVGGWGGTQNFESTTNVKRGTYAIKRVTEAWSGFQIGNGGAVIPMDDFNALKVSIFATTAGKVLVVLNGNYGAGKEVTLVAGQYNDITIPISELGDPATLTEIVIQEFSGGPNLLYIDDLGFI